MNAKHIFASALLALVFLTSGCSVRYVTAQGWQQGKQDVLYTAYLEADCLGGWCTQNTSKVKACVLNAESNELTCNDLAEAEKALNAD